jgi:uncharacterized protein (UPF0276 family)
MPQRSIFGLGMRKPHYAELLETRVAIDFVEVISENFMVEGGRPRDILRRVRERHPVVLHGVSLSVGSADGVDPSYLQRLRQLVDEIEPLYVSDHLCWTRIGGFSAHDLLPLPCTEEALGVVCTAVMQTQDALGRTLLLENPSSYVSFPGVMPEWEFISALCERTGCELLLDVNNIHVCAINHGFDPRAYLQGIPASRVRQIHLAGHSQGKDLLIDTHDQPVAPAVWALYGQALECTGAVATLLERDDNIPPLAELLAELDLARGIAAAVQREAA